MSEPPAPSRRRPARVGILLKTALLSWLVTLATMALFVAASLPSQKRTFLENLASKAHGVSVSLQDVAAGAVVTEDYAAVVDHCTQVLAGDPSIEFLALTRQDGFGLIHRRDGWTSEAMPPAWRPAVRAARSELAQPAFLDYEVFHYARPFDYSGIEWGWIHVGLSLDSYRANLRASYARTAWLAALCILLGLAASVIYAKLITTPILRLRGTAERVAAGDLAARAEVTSGDEVEALASTFNAMTQAVQDREERIRAQNRQLAELVTEKALQSGDLAATARRITEVAAETLRVEQSGVWLFRDGGAAIECLDQFSRSRRSHGQGMRMARAGHEPYFKAVAKARTVSAAEALEDPRTACLGDSYLRPLGITSMLDAGIRVGGEVVGTLCNEHVGASRGWSLEDENFAGSLADLLALAIEARDRKRSQDELIAAKEAAEAASRAKSQFVANMSHEIRTPISGVIGMLQLLSQETRSPSQRRFVSAALNSADALLSVIGDILDFSKIEAGHLELESAEFSLREVLDGTVGLLLDKARLKRLDLSATLASDLPEAVIGDAGRLRQVLLNLMDNAIKFTEAGSVRVVAELRERSAAAVEVGFEVCDTGPGIPDEQRLSIFDAFAQGDPSMHRRHGGTGLGLTISRHLVERMGGRIWVESELGHGTRFAFTVRLGVPAATAARATPSPALLAEGAPSAAPAPPPPAHVLLVEDNEINREVTAEMLLRLGHRCTGVSSGREALRAVHDTEFDLILMDCQMPEMDGYQATAAIRAWEAEHRPGNRVPIIALTAHAMKGDRDRCLDAGMDDYVSKPMRPAAFTAVLAHWLGNRARRHAEQSPESGAAPVPLEPWNEAEVEAAVVERCCGERALASHLLKAYLQQSSVDVGALAAAHAAGDLEQLERTAHRLKGAAGNLGLGISHQAADEIVRLARSGSCVGVDEQLATLIDQESRIARLNLVTEGT